MSYVPNIYTNPYYGTNQFSFQPVNGLVKVQGYEGAQMYQLPPNSVSPPLFVESENAFFIKTTDGGGAATVKKYTFEEAIVDDGTNVEYVTRDYFDKQISSIMEAINGKHTVSEQPATSRELDIRSTEESPVVGAVQRGFQSDV